MKAAKSARLHTAKEGRKLYRMTYLLRQEEKEGKRYLEDKERDEANEEKKYLEDNEKEE